MAQMTTWTMKSDFDALELSVMLVEPEGEVRALVQLSHGMCEHKERYRAFMEYLAGRGCAVIINDHRGHGASVKSREDLGYFYGQAPGQKADSGRRGDAATALVEDLHQLTRFMRARYPDKKLFLFGHSMGSLAVRAYLQKYDADIDALVVCGSPGRNPAAGMGLKLIDLLECFYGDHHRSRMIQDMVVGAFARRFPHPELGNRWLSVNEQNVRDYNEDVLCGFNFTLNGYRALLTLMRRAYRISGARANPELPIHFYSGAEDPCAPDARGFQEAIENLKKSGYAKVSGRMIPEMRHEILNEDARESVYETIWGEAFEPYIT